MGREEYQLSGESIKFKGGVGGKDATHLPVLQVWGAESSAILLRNGGKYDII